MLITDFLLTRRSIRTYKNKALTNEEANKINAILKDVNTSTDLVGFELHTDSRRIYNDLDGHGGYSGVMIYAPAYISMSVLEEKPEAYIAASYLLEKIETRTRNLGLGSCWITLSECSDEKLKEVFPDTKGHVRYVLGLGWPARDLNFGKNVHVPKIGIEDYVFKSKAKDPFTIDELEKMGLADLFYYLRLAPSSKDKQPWRFIIDGGEISLYLVNDDNLDSYVDVGIVMYYFDKLASASSIETKWEIDIQVEGDLVYIGKTKI